MSTKKQRAWPALNRMGIEIDDNVWPFVAGLYATYPEGAGKSVGNFGATCKAIQMKKDDIKGAEGKPTPVERRFQHLLASNQAELKERLLRMVLLAKSQGVSVDYAQLAKDIRSWGWNDRTKTEWAKSFWSQPDSPTMAQDS